MADQGKALQQATGEQQAGPAPPRQEQLLFACGGYVVAQVIALVIFSEPGDEEFLALGIAGAVLGVIAHVLIRGVGINVPGLGRRFRMRLPKVGSRASAKQGKTPETAKRRSRYREALSVFRRRFKRRDRNSEAPGNEERIVETEEGYRVGERTFPRLSEAEDYLYVGSASRGDAENDGGTEASESKPVRWLADSRRNAPIALVITLVSILLALALLFT